MKYLPEAFVQTYFPPRVKVKTLLPDVVAVVVVVVVVVVVIVIVV